MRRFYNRSGQGERQEWEIEWIAAARHASRGHGCGHRLAIRETIGLQNLLAKERGRLGFDFINLYSPQGQDIAGQHYYRPIDPTVAAKFAKQIPKIKLFTVDEVFGGWAKAQKAHFADGGSFDKAYSKR